MTGSRSGGLKGYTGGWSEPSYGWSGTPNGLKHDVIGYSEVRNAKSHSSETQQFVELRRGGAMGHDYGSPPGHDMSKEGNQHRLLAPWHAAAPELHDMAHQGSPKPVHMLNNPRDSPNAGYKHNFPHHNSHGVGSKPHDHGSRYEFSSDDENGSDNESACTGRGRDHGSKVSNCPKAVHEKPNGHNHMTRVNPSVPITTHYESRPLATGPPRIKADAAPDYFHEKRPKHLGAAPVRAQRKGKGHYRIIDSEEARRLYGGVEVPSGGYQREESGDGKGHYGIIDSEEARRRYGGVEVPSGGYRREKSGDVIGADEAAEKYGGVLVPNKIF